MSIRVSERVWRHTAQQGPPLTALLALAWFADDSGECWPSVETLAEMVRLSTRQTRTLLRQLESAGEIVSVAGRGRGHTSRYLVTAGLSPEAVQRWREKGRGASAFDEETRKHASAFEGEKRKSDDEKAEVQRTEKRKFSAPDEAPITASEPAEVAEGEGGIRHGNRHEIRTTTTPLPPEAPAVAPAAPAGGGGRERPEQAGPAGQAGPPGETAALLAELGVLPESIRPLAGIELGVTRAAIAASQRARARDPAAFVTATLRKFLAGHWRPPPDYEAPRDGQHERQLERPSGPEPAFRPGTAADVESWGLLPARPRPRPG